MKIGPIDEPEMHEGELLAMWKTPKKKKSDFVESFVRPAEGSPDAPEHGPAGPNWNAPDTAEAPSFTQDFFQDSHHPHQDDENISLRVLGI